MLVREGNKIRFTNKKKVVEFVALGKSPEVKQAYKTYSDAVKSCVAFLKQLPKCYQETDKDALEIHDNEKLINKLGSVAGLTAMTALAPLASIAATITSISRKFGISDTRGTDFSDIKDSFVDASKPLTKADVFWGNFITREARVYMCAGYTKDSLEEIESFIDGDDPDAKDLGKVIPDTLYVNSRCGSKILKKLYKMDDYETALQEVKSFMNSNSEPVTKIS